MDFLQTGNATCEQERPQPTKFSVAKPYPTPFNSAVTIEIKSQPDRDLTIAVLDITGRQIDYIDTPQKVSGQNGVTSIRWQPDKNTPSGVYLFRINNENGDVAIRKAMLIK